LGIVPASVAVAGEMERPMEIFNQANPDASPSLVPSPVSLVQQRQALSARHRGPVVRRDALHLGAMGGFLVTRVT
jgi:hypothetical protein